MGNGGRAAAQPMGKRGHLNALKPPLRGDPLQVGAFGWRSGAMNRSRRGRSGVSARKAVALTAALFAGALCSGAFFTGTRAVAAGEKSAAERDTAAATATATRTCGVASYYADSLAGNPTASGPPYDPQALTAAHRTLPFGVRLKVTRGAAETHVTVNDRGPFIDGRVIDLSRRAAAALDLLTIGVAEVCYEVLDR
ncbi:MAG: septal ring lytic transglycosylase RlpA family protein [Pseudomonadota bacterium]